MTLKFREVTAETWGDFEQLFESRGGPKYCWCMAERPHDAKTQAERKAAMKSRVDDGTPVGLLAYQDDAPVAWVSIAPRETYRASLSEVGAEGERVWSVVCFFVTRRLRGEGIFHQLLAAAEKHAFAHGATALEGYPVDPDSPSYRFGGFREPFRKAGFRKVGAVGTRRHVVRKRPG